MTRTEIINFFVKHRGFQNYLEIGVDNEQHNFAHIECKRKVAVENKTPSSTTNGSDAFFSKNSRRFDIILIDGLHLENQVLKDIDNALDCLSEGGVIVLHDCLPPDEWHQRGHEAYEEGESWNGTVWKAVLRHFNSSHNKCYIIDTDWGCGIIDTSETQHPWNITLPEDLNYNCDFQLLERYTINSAEFIRNHIGVFYHLACMGNWKEVFREQMMALHKNDFRKLKLTVLGSNEDLEYVEELGRTLGLKFELLFNESELTNYERPGMLAIQEYAKEKEGYVLYLHSKGVSQPKDVTKFKWRRLMMKELIHNWKKCVMQLPNYDVIGVNWRDLPPVSHFCGNFWYASTSYIRRLPDFQYYYDHPRYQIWDSHHSKRLSCEFWIGSASRKPKILSLKYRNVDFCNPSFWKYRR